MHLKVAIILQFWLKKFCEFDHDSLLPFLMNFSSLVLFLMTKLIVIQASRKKNL